MNNNKLTKLFYFFSFLWCCQCKLINMTLLFIIAFQWWYFKVTRSYYFLVQFIFCSCLKLVSLVFFFIPTLSFLLPFSFFFSFLTSFWLIAVDSGLLIYSLFNFFFYFSQQCSQQQSTNRLTVWGSNRSLLPQAATAR